MKGPVRDPSTFTFNATAKTITFSAPIPASQQQILGILNVTRQAWLYLPVQANHGGTWASPVLTLTASTTGHANGDVLQIFVDDGLASTAIVAAALPLPSGAATAANQATANTSLASLDGKLPALSGGRVPVDIGSASISIGASVEVSNDAGNPLPVSGSVYISGTPAVTGPLTDTQLRAAAVPVSGTFWQTTQPISGSVSISGTPTVTGPLTDTQLRATAVPVTGTFWQATQPVSAASLPLPSGAATAAKQPALGTAGAASSDVITVQGIASGVAQPVSGTFWQATQPVSGTFWQATQPVSAASLPLPSGAATSANQSTTNTSLSSIDGKLAALQSGAMPIGDNSGSLTIDGTAYAATVSFTRPANTTAYTAGDVIGTGAGNDAIYTLSAIGSSGGSVLVQSIELVLGISAVPSGMTSFRVHFYDSSPTAAADNSVFDVTSGDRAKYLGYIDLPAPVDLGSTCFTQFDFPGKLFKLASASTSLFCELQTIGGFTPAANSEPYILRVKTLEAGK
jgi:hypothetical protein